MCELVDKTKKGEIRVMSLNLYMVTSLHKTTFQKEKQQGSFVPITKACQLKIRLKMKVLTKDPIKNLVVAKQKLVFSY